MDKQTIKAENLLKNFPAVTSRGVFSLAVSDHTKPIWFGLYWGHRLAVYQAECTPPDPKYNYLLFILYTTPSEESKEQNAVIDFHAIQNTHTIAYGIQSLLKKLDKEIGDPYEPDFSD